MKEKNLETRVEEVINLAEYGDLLEGVKVQIKQEKFHISTKKPITNAIILFLIDDVKCYQEDKNWNGKTDEKRFVLTPLGKAVQDRIFGE
ncbi:hypothetical protein [Aureivirga marina]|uniref:hypothetical protein n=1 Tax=Aureivirga marina TaxID=1182451 RepID=UPI0018C96D3B|nr:hypothetical protein [Aureivirga marina]